MGYLSHIFFPNSVGTNAEREEKILRGKGQGGSEIYLVVWAGQGRCAHEFTAAVAACTRPTQDQARLHFKHGRGGAHKLLPFSEELWAVDSIWGAELIFCKGVTPGRLTMFPWIVPHP